MLSISRRRIAAITLALATAATLDVAVLSQPSSADDDSTLTVVGTSDVFDSNLVTAVLKPGFEKAYPQYTLNYVSKGTGAAIAYAEAGTASALIVHAASLENQFVDQDYSLEPYGRAIFWGDYVLLGPASDPAGVMTGATPSDDITTAYEKVAAAGAAGTANFVSRGGTPGTTVQEHAIWSTTTGVSTCTVSDANGGGTSPSTTTGACANPVASPSWYHSTGLTQGPNIVNGDTCNYSGGNCYVFTDRGTYQYLESTGAISNLHIVARSNDQTPPALSNLLVNSFHAYAVNPAKFADNPDVQINTTAATAFLNWVTSPAGQAAVAAYLSSGSPSDPPFIPSAAPDLTVTSLPATKVDGGKRITIKGTLANAVPGTPALDGVPVKLMARPAAAPGAVATKVATGLTDASGKFKIAYTPKASQIYTVETGKITKIENAALNPVFGDLLQATSAEAGSTKVVGDVTVKRAEVAGRSLHLSGRLLPRVSGARATLTLLAAHPGKKLKEIGHHKLADGTSKYAETFKLGSGTWTYRLAYANSGVIQAGTSKTAKVTVP